MQEILRGCLHANETLSMEGGAEKIVRTTAVGLARRGINVGLVSARNFEGTTGLPEHVFPYFNGQYSQLQIEAFADQTINLMESQGYDLLHVYSVSNSDLLTELAKRIPIFKTVIDSRTICPSEYRIKPDGVICEESVGQNCSNCMQDLGFTNPAKEKKLLRSLKSIETMHHFSYIFAPSDYIKRQLVLNGVPDSKVRVIPLFLPGDPDTEDKTHEYDPESFKSDVLFVGRLIEVKGIDKLLDAFSLLDERYSLTIVGDRPAYVSPRDFKKENPFGKRVQFAGWVDNDTIDEYYQSSKVCVVPSMWPEAFGIVGLEAMKNKKPVVAFDTGGISEWLHDGENGFLVPRGNVELLAERIRFLLEHPAVAREMGEAGYQLLNTQFREDKHIDSLVFYYKEGLK